MPRVAPRGDDLPDRHRRDRGQGARGDRHRGRRRAAAGAQPRATAAAPTAHAERRSAWRRERRGSDDAAEQPRERPTARPRLELRGIRKVYPAVVANDGIDLAVMPGEIHAVLGENGAGKSTLMKIIYGVTRPTDGEMFWEGRPVDAGQSGARARRSASAWCSSTSRCSRR